MRFRRRRPRRVKARGMHGDWVVGVDHNCMLPIVSVMKCSDTAAPNDTTDFSLLDTQDVEDKEDALTVVRIVGDVPIVSRLKFSSEPPGINMVVHTIREGIYLSTVDPNGVAVDMDPRLPGDMESDCWLWLRTRSFKFAYVGPATSPPPGIFWQAASDYNVGQNDHLDIRVKRKLKRGQELIYTVGAFHEVTEGSAVINTDFDLMGMLQPHLRCYVKY